MAACCPKCGCPFEPGQLVWRIVRVHSAGGLVRSMIYNCCADPMENRQEQMDRSNDVFDITVTRVRLSHGDVELFENVDHY